MLLLLVVTLWPTTAVMVTGGPLFVDCPLEQAECEDLKRDLADGGWAAGRREGFPVTWYVVQSGGTAMCHEHTFGYWWPVYFDPTAVHGMPLC